MQMPASDLVTIYIQFVPTNILRAIQEGFIRGCDRNRDCRVPYFGFPIRVCRQNHVPIGPDGRGKGFVGSGTATRPKENDIEYDRLGSGSGDPLNQFSVQCSIPDADARLVEFRSEEHTSELQY